jgi:hypothetical protein
MAGISSWGLWFRVSDHLNSTSEDIGNVQRFRNRYGSRNHKGDAVDIGSDAANGSHCRTRHQHLPGRYADSRDDIGFCSQDRGCLDCAYYLIALDAEYNDHIHSKHIVKFSHLYTVIPSEDIFDTYIKHGIL